MDDEERQRTMDFILQQQAQFSAGMQRLEEADARADRRLGRLERTVVLMIRQFRRERRDLRERIAALVDSQIRTEEITRQNSEDIRALNAAMERDYEAIRGITRQNSEVIRSNSEAIRALTAATERDRVNIASLADMIDKLTRRQSGNGDGE